MMGSGASASAEHGLRRGLLALAGLTTGGVVLELAAERHWTQPIQLIAWGAAGLLVVAIALVQWGPSRGWVRTARWLAAVAVLSAIWGVGVHVYANYDAGELDRRYSSSWDSVPEIERWALALSKTVGPSPPFAPGALAQAGLAVLLATVGHPVLGAYPTAPAAEKDRPRRRGRAARKSGRG